jgi:flavin reductase (DIM6/NTAB) family NADH-FMN oxidoreductase RutF
MSIERDLFRRVMGSFASGVTVVTVVGPDGMPTGFTASAVSSLSLDPRMLLVCVNERSATLTAVKEAGSFVVNILSAQQQEVAQQFATRRDDRFGGIRWRTGPATGAPVLDGSLAFAECILRDTCQGGDHVILMGEIVAGDAHEAEPLLYFRGRYGTYEAVVAPVVHPADIWEIW